MCCCAFLLSAAAKEPKTNDQRQVQGEPLCATQLVDMGGPRSILLVRLLVKLQCRGLRVAFLSNFQAFNVEMDELTRIQRSYAIPDGVLRGRVKQGNVDFLLPKYNEFHGK